MSQIKKYSMLNKLYVMGRCRHFKSKSVFRLDALALSVIATATWLAGWLAGWLGGCPSQPVLYQND